MKTIFFLLLILASAQQLSAAGYTLVNISNVKSIQVRQDVVVIRGDARYESRIVTDKQHANDTVGSHPAQWIYGTIYDGLFELKAYQSNYHDPRNEHIAERASLEKQFKESWEKTKKTAGQVKVGGSIVIAFQGEETIIQGFRIVKVSGSGTIQSSLDKNVAK